MMLTNRGGHLVVVALALSMALAIHALADEPWKDARLFDAVAAGKIDVVRAALDQGKDPNTKSPFWGSLLHYAALRGQLDVVKLLVAKGADPRAKDNEDILLAPIKAERLDIVTFLVSKGASTVRPKDGKAWDGILVAATRTGNLEMVEYLISHGADPNETSSQCDESALMVAAARERVDILKRLLRAGADINHRDWNGWSALMHACKGGKGAAVVFLLSFGADPSFVDGYDRTAASVAAPEIRALCTKVSEGATGGP